MQFEWNPEKARRNETKHGVSSGPSSAGSRAASSPVRPWWAHAGSKRMMRREPVACASRSRVRVEGRMRPLFGVWFGPCPRMTWSGQLRTRLIDSERLRAVGVLKHFFVLETPPPQAARDEPLHRMTGVLKG